MSDPLAPPSLGRGDAARLVEQRIETVRRISADHGGVLLRRRRDFAWLTLGGQNHVLLASELGAAPMLVTPTRAIVLAPVNEADRIADEEVTGLPIEVEAIPWWDAEATMRLARRMCGREDIATSDRLAAELETARTALAPSEHERMAWLGQLVGTVMSEAVGGAHAGQTEHEVAAAVEARLASAGVRLPVLLAAADERIERYRHPLPTDRRVDRRLMVVVVAERWGLHVAQTTFRELAPLPDAIARRAGALQRVIAAMRAATVVGATLGTVLDVARRAYADAGINDEWELHHQGGTIGYGARERIATPDDATPVRPGMAFAWNPSARGYKLEETLYLDEAGMPHLVAPRVS